jgi:hypothetical protein
MAFRTAIVIASFLIGLEGLARESFAQYYPSQAYPPPRDYPLAGYQPPPPVDADRCRLVITICRPPVDPTSAQPILVKSIPWRPD